LLKFCQLQAQEKTEIAQTNTAKGGKSSPIFGRKSEQRMILRFPEWQDTNYNGALQRIGEVV
jgi:hypothetical protein